MNDNCMIWSNKIPLPILPGFIDALNEKTLLEEILHISRVARDDKNFISCAAAIITINEYVEAFLNRDNGGNNAA